MGYYIALMVSYVAALLINFLAIAAVQEKGKIPLESGPGIQAFSILLGFGLLFGMLHNDLNPVAYLIWASWVAMVISGIDKVKRGYATVGSLTMNFFGILWLIILLSIYAWNYL